MSDIPQKTDRRERRRLAVQARVLEAAWALFEEQGYDASPVAQICERADIAYGTFFNHFAGKHAVLRLMADRVVTNLEEKLEELSKQSGTIEEHLILLLEGDVREHRNDERLRRDLLGRIYSIAYAESPEDRDRRYHAAFERYIGESVARGRVRDDTPVETLADIVASVVGSFSLSRVHFEDFPLHRRARDAARLLSDSLQPRST